MTVALSNALLGIKCALIQQQLFQLWENSFLFLQLFPHLLCGSATQVGIQPNAERWHEASSVDEVQVCIQPCWTGQMGCMPHCLNLALKPVESFNVPLIINTDWFSREQIQNRQFTTLLLLGICKGHLNSYCTHKRLQKLEYKKGQTAGGTQQTEQGGTVAQR